MERTTAIPSGQLVDILGCFSSGIRRFFLVGIPGAEHTGERPEPGRVDSESEGHPTRPQSRTSLSGAFDYAAGSTGRGPVVPGLIHVAPDPLR